MNESLTDLQPYQRRFLETLSTGTQLEMAPPVLDPHKHFRAALVIVSLAVKHGTLDLKTFQDAPAVVNMLRAHGFPCEAEGQTISGICPVINQPWKVVLKKMEQL